MAEAPSFDRSTVEFLLAWQSLEVASRNVRERFAEKAGLSLGDFQTLVFLSAKNGSPAKVVGQALGLTTGATTALIDRLENANYITREPHPTDRRSTLLMLTASGLAAATDAGALYASVAEAILPASERSRATELFTRLAETLDPQAEPEY